MFSLRWGHGQSTRRKGMASAMTRAARNDRSGFGLIALALLCGCEWSHAVEWFVRSAARRAVLKLRFRAGEFASATRNEVRCMEPSCEHDSVDGDWLRLATEGRTEEADGDFGHQTQTPAATQAGSPSRVARSSAAHFGAKRWFECEVTT